MNRYIAYIKKNECWKESKLQELMSREEAIAAIQGKYWLTGISAARAVLQGSSTKFTHISPIRENREIKYMFSNKPIYMEV